MESPYRTTAAYSVQHSNNILTIIFNLTGKTIIVEVALSITKVHDSESFQWVRYYHCLSTWVPEPTLIS